MAINPINPFDNNGANPFKALQSGNKALVAKYLAAKDMAQYQKLQHQKTDAELKVTSFGTLLNNLSIMNDAIERLKKKGFSGLKTTLSSNSSYVTATANSFAAAGNYSIQIGRIAQSHNILSTTFASDSSPVADLSVYTTQKLRLQVGTGQAKEITINSSNNTLTGIRDAINNAQAGLTATITAFDVTSANNKIKFKVGGSTYIATIDEGSYSGEQLATKVKMAFINAYSQGGDKFNASYNNPNNKFTITNTTGNGLEILWDDAETTARQMLGFDATNETIQNNGSTTSDNAAEISGYRLLLSSDSTGKDYKISVKADVDGNGIYGDSADDTANSGLGRLVFDAVYNASDEVIGGVTNMSQSQKAQDALIKFNNTEYTRATNNIADIIPGVTINLQKADPNYGSNPQTFKIAVYPMGLEADLKTFVSSFNITANVIDKQRGDAKEPGVLSDDSMMNQLDSDLRNYFVANGATLTSLGLKYTTKGRLELDENRLKTLISQDAAAVTNASNLFSSRLSIKVSGYINTEIPRQQATYEDAIKDIQRQEQRVKASLKVKQLMITNAENPLNELLNQPAKKEGGLLGLLSSSVSPKKKK